MRRTLLALLALAACEKATPAPAAKPFEGSNPGPGSGARSPAAKALIDQIANDCLTYAKAAMPVTMAFDGDCKAQIDRLLTLEPITTKIRVAMTQLLAIDPTGEADLKAELMQHKAATLGEMNGWLESHHVTMADGEAKDKAIRSACGDDPEFRAAMDRVGVFKKKKP